MMMMMVMVTMMVNVCDDDCYLVMKVKLDKEVMSCDVSPVAMFVTPLNFANGPKISRFADFEHISEIVRK